MAQAANETGFTPGAMDITEQSGTFQFFLKATLWFSIHLAMIVALLVAAFAVGAGWWAGVMAFFGVGVAAGLLFRMRASYWVIMILLSLLLVVGGAIILAVV